MHGAEEEWIRSGLNAEMTGKILAGAPMFMPESFVRREFTCGAPLLLRQQRGRRRFSTRHRAQSWSRARRVVAKVEWHKGELFPRVGFIVTNLGRCAKRVLRFYNQRGMAEQRIKKGNNAVKWTRLSCHDFADNQVRLHLFVLAHNLANSCVRRPCLERFVTGR